MGSLRCGECGAENPDGNKFCGECGSSLTDRPPAPEARTLSEERRRATVLFADLSGYTAIAEGLDPEDAKALIEGALQRLSREVVKRDGHVDKYIGDNVMAVFGAPVAHEDDPERAVRAGLAMQAAMNEINAEIAERAASRDIELALRVGINSGEVLAGHVGDQYTVIGDAVNVAARLQAAGAIGAVTVGGSTRRLTAEAIEYRPLEPLALKGKAHPIPAWEAVGALDPASRPRRRPAAAPMIGRDEELALLLSLFERSRRESRPHLVTVFGEAGVGKSRLLTELAAALEERAEPAATLIGRSPAYGTTTAYAALGEILRNRFAISREEARESGIERLGAGIAALSDDPEIDPARTAAQVARAFGIGPRDEEAEDVEPEEIRDRIFASVRLILELLAADSPLLVAFEDVHWADEGMLDLIEHLASAARGPVLFVCLARDELLERRPGWGGGSRNSTTISLDPLPAEEAEGLARSLLEDAGPARELAAEVAVRSGGNPLFAEEIVNRLREEDSGDLGELPDSVHAVLAARLDALRPEERQLLQAAAVIGQSFWEELVAELSDGPDTGELLTALIAKDLLAPSPANRPGGERELSFKHALVRDVAYATLPRAVRARRHVEVAGIVEGRAEENRERFAALLAEHYVTAAELGEQASFPPEELARIRASAARASEASGDVAAAVYSNAEAIAHYENALRFPSGLDAEGRARVEESLGDTAFRAGHVGDAIAGWSRALTFQEEDGTPARAGELHRKIGSGLWHKGDRETSIAHFQQGIDLLKDGEPCGELIELYEDAASFYVETGDNLLAIYAAEKAQRLAEDLGESAAATRAHLTFGRVFGRVGDLAGARRSFERAVELARRDNPAAAMRALLALGRHLEVAEADYPAARETCEEALRLADELGDVPAQIELHAVLGQLAVHPADWAVVDEHAAASAQLAEREGLSGQLCLPLLLQGISSWRLGDWDAAEARLRRAHEIASAGGRSEAAVSTLLWMGATRRDRGERLRACDAFVEAATIGGEAGLIAQAAEAASARACILARDGRVEEAASAAAEAEELLRRAALPVAAAAAADARGVTAEDAAAAVAELREATLLWERAGRPINVVETNLLLAGPLNEVDPAAAERLLEETALEAERLGVGPHAAAARAAVGA